MPKDDAKFFCVRDLPEATKKKIKLYAAEHDLTMAQALTMLVEAANPVLTEAIEDLSGILVRLGPRVGPMMIATLMQIYDLTARNDLDGARRDALYLITLFQYQGQGQLPTLSARFRPSPVDEATEEVLPAAAKRERDELTEAALMKLTLPPTDEDELRRMSDAMERLSGSQTDTKDE